MFLRHSTLCSQIFSTSKIVWSRKIAPFVKKGGGATQRTGKLLYAADKEVTNAEIYPTYFPRYTNKNTMTWGSIFLFFLVVERKKMLLIYSDMLRNGKVYVFFNLLEPEFYI